MKQTEEMSNGRVRLAAGTLYGALSNLCSKGWIEMVPNEADSRKKEYQITALGKEKLETELKRLKELVANGEQILGGE